MNNYIKQNKPKFIKFTEITFIKRDINQILTIDKLVKYLKRTGTKLSKYAFIAIWKDNDEQISIKKENEQMLAIENELFEDLKKYLSENKIKKENFKIWLLPERWNFETFYRWHHLKILDCSDRDLKEKFKEHNHFINKIFTEKHFKNLHSKLKSLGSNITLFNFEEKVKERTKRVKKVEQIEQQEISTKKRRIWILNKRHSSLNAFKIFKN
ncbi:MAG: hypothetical protein REH79_03325 [Spiroplasma sp.]|nr:hypothetical protein [Spiroplasma sp.]